MSRFTISYVECSAEEYRQRLGAAVSLWVDIALNNLDKQQASGDSCQKSGRPDVAYQGDPKHDYSLAT
jgi:hypothetical protein